MSTKAANLLALGAVAVAILMAVHPSPLLAQCVPTVYGTNEADSNSCAYVPNGTLPSAPCPARTRVAAYPKMGLALAIPIAAIPTSVTSHTFAPRSLQS